MVPLARLAHQPSLHRLVIHVREQGSADPRLRARAFSQEQPRTAAFAVCGSALAAVWYGVVQIRVSGSEGKLTSRARDSPPASPTESRLRGFGARFSRRSQRRALLPRRSPSVWVNPFAALRTSFEF